MSESWNVETVADSKPEASPEKPTTPAAAAIPSVLSNDHSLGKIMSTARENRGLSREQAAKSSNIPGYYLTMIETDDYSAIADQLYLLPFLRRYAVFVALEPEEVASRFIRDVQRADMNPGRASEPITMFEPRKPFPWRIVMTVAWAILVVAGGWFGYRYYQARKALMANLKPPAPVVSAIPEAEQTAPKVEDASDQKVAAPANVAPAPVAIPSTAVLPEAAPSVAAAPAPAAAPSMATAPPAVPQAAASPIRKPLAKTASHGAMHPHNSLKSASPVRRLSMRN